MLKVTLKTAYNNSQLEMDMESFFYFMSKFNQAETVVYYKSNNGWAKMSGESANRYKHVIFSCPRVVIDASC